MANASPMATQERAVMGGERPCARGRQLPEQARCPTTVKKISPPARISAANRNIATTAFRLENLSSSSFIFDLRASLPDPVTPMADRFI